MATYMQKIVYDKDGNKYHRVSKLGSDKFLDIPEGNWPAFLEGDFWAGEEWDEGCPTVVDWTDSVQA